MPHLAISKSRKPGGAWVLIFSPDKQHVMMAKRSSDSNNPNKWNFWGGGIDEGETPKQAARRELFEESGIKVNELKKLGAFRNFHFYGIVMPITTRVPDIDKKENSGYKWFKTKTLLKRLKKVNPPTLIGIRNKVHLDLPKLPTQ